MAAVGQDSEELPNIVVLVLDTARARNLSCYNPKNSNTEHIDRLSDRGVLFKNATSVSPWTLPSHASLFTGVPPSVHRTNSLESSLPDSLLTVAETLSDAGYRTVGMSANPWFSSQFGITRGFDEFHHLFGPLATDSYREFANLVTDGTEGLVGRISHLVSEQSPVEIFRNSVTAAYRQLIDREDDGGGEAVEKGLDVFEGPEPYFLFINFLEPHLPYEPPLEYLDSVISEFSRSGVESVNQNAPAYNIRNVDMSPDDFEILEALYDAELAYVDDCIGELLDGIEQNGHRENTLVAVLGDHGENIGDHGLMSHHYSVNETLLHIPLVLRYPGVFEGGGIVEDRVWSIDLPATLDSVLRSSGVDTGDFGEQQQGIPLHREDPGDRSIVAEYLNPMPPISKMQARCENPDFDVSTYDRTFRAVYEGRFKFIRDSDGRRELYDVVSDIQEQNNLVEQKPDVRDELAGELTSWVEEYGEVTDPRSAPTDVDEQIEDRLQELGYL